MNKCKLLFVLVAGVFAFVGFGSLIFNCYGYSVFAKENVATKFMIDDFSQNKLQWWGVFGNIKTEIVMNSKFRTGDPKVIKEVGKYSLSILGSKVSNWYAGGMQINIFNPNVQYGNYNAFQMDIFGNGPKSGSIMIKLIDDNKGLKFAERGSMDAYTANDIFQYSVPIKWVGWKRVTIPINNFKLQAPKRGDGILTLSKTKNMNGLIEIGLIYSASSSKEANSPKYNIDNICLVKK
jgi:hypothetical protein